MTGDRRSIDIANGVTDRSVHGGQNQHAIGEVLVFARLDGPMLHGALGSVVKNLGAEGTDVFAVWILSVVPLLHVVCNVLDVAASDCRMKRVGQGQIFGQRDAADGRQEHEDGDLPHRSVSQLCRNETSVGSARMQMDAAAVGNGSVGKGGVGGAVGYAGASAEDSALARSRGWMGPTMKIQATAPINATRPTK